MSTQIDALIAQIELSNLIQLRKLYAGDLNKLRGEACASNDPTPYRPEIDRIKGLLNETNTKLGLSQSS